AGAADPQRIAGGRGRGLGERRLFAAGISARRSFRSEKKSDRRYSSARPLYQRPGFRHSRLRLRADRRQDKPTRRQDPQFHDDLRRWPGDYVAPGQKIVERDQKPARSLQRKDAVHLAARQCLQERRASRRRFHIVQPCASAFQSLVSRWALGRRYWAMRAQGSRAPRARSWASLVWTPTLARRDLQSTQRVDPKLGGDSDQGMDAHMLSRRHRSAPPD